MSDILNDVMDEEATFEAPSPAVKAPFPSFSFSIKKFVFHALLEKASSVVPRKDTMPVLKNFQFDVGPGSLRVVATDLELMVVSKTAMVEAPVVGQAVFPAVKTLDITREADEGDVLVVVKDGTAKITVGKASWDLKLQRADDFPPIPDVEDTELHKVDRAKFLGGLRAVRYAAAKDATRPPLMMIDVSNGKMTACDGVRFQQANLGSDFPLSLRIPTAAIDDLMKLLGSTDLSHIGIGESDYSIIFKIGADYFIANKLMAQFPDVEEMLLRPALANKYKLLVDRQELVTSIKRVKINADPETSAIALVLSLNKLRVLAHDKTGNEASEELDVSWHSGNRQLVVNHAFLSQMLDMYENKSCKFLLGEDTKGRKSPVMLKDEETGNIGVIQQMASDWLGYKG